MRWDYEFVDDGPFDVIAKTSGVVTVDGLKQGRERLYVDPRLRPGAKILLDHADLEGSLTADELRTVASASSDAFLERQIGYCAIVVPRAFTYGLTRMWHAYLTARVWERTTVVMSVEKAHEWIEEKIQSDG